MARATTAADHDRNDDDRVASETGRNAADYEAESHADGDDEDKRRTALELVGLIGPSKEWRRDNIICPFRRSGTR
jgi:hypothetical protein